MRRLALLAALVAALFAAGFSGGGDSAKAAVSPDGFSDGGDNVAVRCLEMDDRKPPWRKCYGDVLP